MTQLANKSLFIEKSLKFENGNINNELIPIPIINSKFGILDLKANSSCLSQEEFEFIFMIDCSDSMADNCSDGISKMNHTIHTLKNMILYFKENSIKIHITVNSFDNEIYNIIERCIITEDNYISIIDNIEKIVPKEMTNIELALKSVKNTISQIKKHYLQQNIISIFMTDGEATVGNSNHNYLSGLVDRSVKNIFIGFGIDHDSVLLNALSNGENSSYYFIDKLDNSALIYGEILHGILYNLLTNVEITVKNGLIYDFKNNIWVKTLNIEEIASESNKTYHIASSTPENCSVSLSANTSYEENINCQELNSESLIKYIYRQRTLQHLYIVSNFLERENISSNLIKKIGLDISNKLLDSINKEKKTIQENLCNFLEEMKEYMKDNKIENDKFIKNLCDDIYISYKTFGTIFASMYNNARQISQGIQRCYSVSHIPEELNETVFECNTQINHLQRQVTLINSNYKDTNLLNNNLTQINYILSDFDNNPYLNRGITEIMDQIC